MIDKVDLVMWAKNGESVLPEVLKRIDEVIPHEHACHKILVDDHSIDRTVEIAKDFNWDVYLNPKGGIPGGANEALRHVNCNFFVSVEQDVVLAKDWWEKISPYMDNDKTAVAQGIRMSTEPTLRKLDEYVYSRLKSGIDDPIRFGVSMDNNIFRTKIIRQLGGFPNDCLVCTDTILMRKIIYETPYKWVIDMNVVSDHIRQSVKAHIEHAYTLTKLCANSHYCVNEAQPILLTLRMFLTSPIRASIVAYKKRCPKLLYVYPAIRYKKFKACIEEKCKL
jgi:cellulose synthase/poly-beta-1,6-N-acetylglucosamine synthase-like glycosyltransferase